MYITIIADSYVQINYSLSLLLFYFLKYVNTHNYQILYYTSITVLIIRVTYTQCHLLILNVTVSRDVKP